MKLQGIDLDGDRIHEEQDELEERLEEVKGVLGHLQKDLAQQQVQLEETEQLRDEKNAQFEEVTERHKQSKARLGKVSNTKEYSAIELEIENYKRQAGQLEEELVQLMDAIETTRASISEKTDKISTLEDTVKLQGKKTASRLKELDKKMDSMEAERDRLAGDITNRVVKRYDFIRSRRSGSAIVSAEGGSCQGCFMALPPQQYIELQRGKKMLSCPSCQRILYFPSSEGA